jgi:hypothetical protein
VTVVAAGGFTVMLTVAAELVAPWLSVTSSEKVKTVAAPTVGAVNVGCAMVALLSATAGPAVCDQA